LETLWPPFYVDGREVFLSASIGVSMFPRDGRQAPELVHNAGMALHAVKQTGGGAYQIYNADMSAYATARMAMESDLRDAVKNEEFFLHFQPQLDLGNASLYPSGRRATVRAAALINGSAANTVEFDHIYRDALYHPGAPVISAALAIAQAEQHNLPVLLIDREIGITLKRVVANVSWWKRAGLVGGLLASVLSRDEVSEEEIERLKEGDMLETTFSEFAAERKDLFDPLIAERDRFMAARITQEQEEHGYERILAVIGAGHQKGIAEQLEQGVEEPARVIEELEQLPKKRSWLKMVPWVIAALIITGFVIGFSRSAELGWHLIAEWVVINGTLSAFGALIAGAHIVTIVTAFVAAPITSLNPTIGAGMVTAAVETLLRKPRVGDFENLRHDVTHWTGWWKNRVSRILLVFLFSTLGSAAGTYIAGFRIFDQLF